MSWLIGKRIKITPPHERDDLIGLTGMVVELMPNENWSYALILFDDRKLGYVDLDGVEVILTDEEIRKGMVAAGGQP